MSNFKSILDVSLENKTLFNKIESLLKSDSFPCLFALNAFHKNHMYIYDATELTNKEIYLKIYNQLTLFADFIKNKKNKNFYTILIIIKDPLTTSSEYLEDLIFSFLINLKKQDTTKNMINKDDILRSDFQFCLDKNIWFPVFLCPQHISTITKSTISVIAFQPNQTFDILKKHPNNFYEKTRLATHKRINKIYNNNKPFFLSEKSSGINAIQYLGFDPIHPNEK